MSWGDAARRFHRSTAHTRARTVRAGMIQLGPAARPPQLKGYAGGEVLPFDSHSPPPLAAPALASLAGHAGADRTTPARADLERLLLLANGVLRWRPSQVYEDGRIGFRAAPCTGALYHVELYLACGDLDRLPAGLYHHDAQAPGLRRLRAGAPRRPPAAPRAPGA